MRHVKILTDVMDVARRAADRWYVTTGDTAVGPVNLDLIARGVEAGKVPLGAFVRHEGWRVWRRLSELAEITSDDPSVDEGARLSTDDISEMGRPSTPEDFLPADAIDGAADRRDAFMLLMTAAVVRGGAEVALVHEIDDEGAVVVGAHGARTGDVVGMRTSLCDAAMVAAAWGATVIAGPSSGPEGQAIVDRLHLVAPQVDGAMMIPIRPGRRLAGVLELGRREAFRPLEIASLEALVDALEAKLEGWGRA